MTVAKRSAVWWSVVVLLVALAAYCRRHFGLHIGISERAAVWFLLFAGVWSVLLATILNRPYRSFMQRTFDSPEWREAAQSDLVIRLFAASVRWSLTTTGGRLVGVVGGAAITAGAAFMLWS